MKILPKRPQVTDEFLEFAKKTAIARYPNECVIMIDDKGNFRELENIHPEPQKAFLVRESIIKDKICVLLHTHTKMGRVEPISDEDIIEQEKQGIPWMVMYAIKQDDEIFVAKPITFGIDEDITTPIMQDVYGSIGYKDCFTLVRRFFYQTADEVMNSIRTTSPAIRRYMSQKKCVYIPNAPRGGDYGRMYEKLINESQDFKIVNGSELQVGDVLVDNANKTQDSRIYLGDNIDLRINVSDSKPVVRVSYSSTSYDLLIRQNDVKI